MKRWVLALVVLSWTSGPAAAATPAFDSTAVRILDHMSRVIGELHACSFRLDVVRDVPDRDHGLVTQHVTSTVHMSGPNRMRIDSRFDSAHRGFWYDGSTLAYYSYDENNYAVVDAPPTIIETIEQVSRDYDIDFPAADFFYPTFTDDLIDHSTGIHYLGRKMVAGTSCFHVLALSKASRIQIWVADDSFNLPLAFSITETGAKPTHYVGRFSEWQLNPEVPSAIFDFLPPQKAARVTLVPRKAQ